MMVEMADEDQQEETPPQETNDNEYQRRLEFEEQQDRADYGK